MKTAFQTHDLLVLDSGSIHNSLSAVDPEQQEVMLRLLTDAPVVVVRRAQSQCGRLAVGVRGKYRHERFAAWLDPQAVIISIAPTQLRLHSVAEESRPAMQSLFSLQEQWGNATFEWGPGGSVGFDLASGVRSVSATSDLDIVVRIQSSLADLPLREMAADCERLPAAVDVLLETQAGAFALRELLLCADDVVLRTPNGPMLVLHPCLPVWGACA